MYERLLSAIQKSGCGIAQIGRDEVDAEGSRLPDICVPPKEEEFIKSEDFLRELLLHKGDCSFCTKLLKRELLQRKASRKGCSMKTFIC